MPDPYVFVVATYVDLAEAGADHSAVHQLSSELGSSQTLEAVTIGRKVSGEIRFDRRTAQSSGSDTPAGVDASLAQGLALAIYPSVGADVPRAWLAQHETLSAVAGEVARGLGRDVMRDLGRHLDSATAALLVAAPSALESRVGEAITRASSVMVRTATIDVALIERASRSAQRAASPTHER